MDNKTLKTDLIQIKNHYFVVKSPVLISPLNWGIGHATRCIPIIYDLLNLGHQITIAADGNTAQVLKQEFPAIQLIKIRSFEIKYASRYFALSIFKQVPKILWGIWLEHQQLKKVQTNFAFKTIISDNRYGLFHKKVLSIFVGHQINIQLSDKLKFVQFFLNWINHKMIEQFDQCWIPDSDGIENLSGVLSHPSNLNIKTYYIGLLSRFQQKAIHAETQYYQFVFILSGPEPLRSIWEDLILNLACFLNHKSILIRGLANSNQIKLKGFLEIRDWIAANEMREIIEKSACVVCRSGYSTLMDLNILNRRAIVVPTPGQTEQEYLADYLEKKSIVFSIKQHDFNIEVLNNIFKKNKKALLGLLNE